MIVVITDEAEADLEGIGDYIATENPQRSATFVRELVKRCYGLSDMPRRFPVMPHYEHTNIRRLVHHDYLIFYRIDGDAISILRIINGSVDYLRILFPDE